MPVPCFALAKSRVAKVVCAEIECGQECGEALITISDSIERWEKQLQLFPTNQDIFASVSKLFARILQYLVQATLHLSSSYPARTSATIHSSQIIPTKFSIFAGLAKVAGRFSRIKICVRPRSGSHELRLTTDMQ